MSPVRTVALTLLAALGFALTHSTAPGRQPTNGDTRVRIDLLPSANFTGFQQPKDDKDPVEEKPADYREILNYKNNGIAPAKLLEAKGRLAAFAKYNAAVVSYQKRYVALQDPTVPVPDYKALDGPNGILAELEQRVLVPTPSTKLVDRVAQFNYVRELGEALDPALKELILKHPERIVRVNATRMLAIACKSGAWSHYATVTALLTDPQVPAEVKYYALQAAGNLLAAYDVDAYIPSKGGYDNRKHSFRKGDLTEGGKQDPDLEPDRPIGQLVAALEKAVLEPASLLGVVAKDDKPAEIPDDLKPVAAFFRRQAVRSLAQVRFPIVPGPKNTTLYPIRTLARVALTDPSLEIKSRVQIKGDNGKPIETEMVWSPRADEIADAVIGVCNLEPPAGQGERDVYAPGAAEVIASGVLSYGAGYTASPQDKAVPWRGGAARLIEAISRWRVRFHPTLSLTPIVLNNPDFDPDKDPRLASGKDFPPAVQAVYDQSRRLVLEPIVNKTSGFNLEAMRIFLLQEVRKGTEKEPTITLFENPKLTVPRKAL
jgi:hypothetical protein